MDFLTEFDEGRVEGIGVTMRSHNNRSNMTWRMVTEFLDDSRDYADLFKFFARKFAAMDGFVKEYETEEGKQVFVLTLSKDQKGEVLGAIDAAGDLPKNIKIYERAMRSHDHPIIVRLTLLP